MMEILDDRYFMKKALQEAHIACEKGEVPVGAVIVFQQQIIARGHNLTETLKDVTAHAEMIAITAASNHIGGKYLKGCSLYVTLEPCSMCAGALYWSQVDRIVAAASDPKRGYRSYHTPLHPKTTATFGVCEKEASQMLTNFFKQKRI